jgi:hypothetical protein
MNHTRKKQSHTQGTTRRVFILAGLAALVGSFMLFHRKAWNFIKRITRSKDFAATPPLLPHDPEKDRAVLYVSKGKTPAENIDRVLSKMGGMGSLVGKNDLVIIKPNAQWWNQGMTNVSAVKRTIEHVLELPGFSGEIVVFENVHFRMKDGSGLARAWVHPSERNVDVPGWNKLGDLIPHFSSLNAPVSFVGLIDAGKSALSEEGWHDPDHACGVYDGDGRGPIQTGDDRDGYHWDFSKVFRLKRGPFEEAKTILTWPRFSSPFSGLVIDLRDGVFERKDGKLKPLNRKLVWINMTGANEHSDTGITGACKSIMGVVDMSAGRLGLDPRVQEYLSTHFFGGQDASFRMAGPLAHFAKHVRKPDLILCVAEWIAVSPEGVHWDYNKKDIRMETASAVHAQTVVAGVDPVAIDTWCTRHLLMPASGKRKGLYNLDDENSQVVKFLRYYRQVSGHGSMDLNLIDMV